MDNLLVQVSGSKRVLLFPPEAAPGLYLKVVGFVFVYYFLGEDES